MLLRFPQVPLPCASSRRCLPALTLLLGIACCLAAVFFVNEPSNDVAVYYGPMARAFGAGDYRAAFHPMIPPLVPVSAGVLAALGISPFAALKAVSCTLFLLGLIPLRRLLQRVPVPVQDLAAWGGLLYVVCPRLLRYATMGTLEGAKIFFLLWLAERTTAAVESGRWSQVLQAGAALAGLSLARGEGVFFLPLPVALLLWGEWRRQPTARWRGLRTGMAKAAAMVGVCLVLVVPWVVYQYRATGYPALDSRQTWLFQSLAARAGWVPAPAPLEPVPAGTVRLAAEVPADAYGAWRSAREAVKGLFPAYLGLAVIGLFLRCRRRRWHWLESVSALTILYNAALFAASGFITKRYTAPTIPFLLPWVTLGGAWVLCLLQRLPALTVPARKRLAAVVAFLFVSVCAWDGMSKVRPAWPPERNLLREAGLWLRAHAGELDVNRAPGLTSASWGSEYHNGRQPVVAACVAQPAFWAGADLVMVRKDTRYPYAVLTALCRSKTVDVLVRERHLDRVVPDFDACNRHFRVLAVPGLPESVRLYVFTDGPGVAPPAEPRADATAELERPRS